MMVTGKVCQEAAECFRSLENYPLTSYENLIRVFCDSAAYQENSFPILFALEKSPLPFAWYHVPCVSEVPRTL